MNGKISKWSRYRAISNLMRVRFRYYFNMERTLTTYAMFKVDEIEKQSDQEQAIISFNICYDDRRKSSCINVRIYAVNIF